MKKNLLVFFLICTSQSFAQPSLRAMKSKKDLDKSLRPMVFEMKIINSTQASILFERKNIAVKQEDAVKWISNQLELRQNIDALEETGMDVTTNDFTLKKVQQYYKGIKVEHGIVNATSLRGNLSLMQLEFYSIPDNFKTTPLLNEQQALDKALAFVNAEKYVWTNYKSTDPLYAKPKGELVIIQTYKEEGEVCLAYKFCIYAVKPLYRAYVYINAWDGTVVLDDPLIKHSRKEKPNINQAEADKMAAEKNMKLINESGTGAPLTNANGNADTRNYGRKSIVTDFYSGVSTKPYRLREARNNHEIITLNYEQHSKDLLVSPTYESTAPDFTDNNNDWTSAEYVYQPTQYRGAALDAHYCIEKVSDYWKIVHDRNSFDNNYGAITSYIHVWSGGVPYNNAYWNGFNMHFGDGDGTITNPAQTSLDDCAHELAHAITQHTSQLVYRWESGALNEGFSDIWASCITNYVTKYEPSIVEDPWRLFEKSSNVGTANPGLRDMKNPLLYNDPSTYKSTKWVPGSYADCKTENANLNDHCGVHSNSGVLNKWFFLITQGEMKSNTENHAYDITGIGFGETQKIAYLMELNLTPNSSYATAMNVSLNIASTLYGPTSTEYNTLKDAWVAVGVDSNVYDMNNSPAFTTNNFTSVAVGKNGNIIAGTNYGGMYKYDGSNWQKFSELTDVRFNDIKPDKDGNIWIAQSGRSGTQGGGSSIGGGVNYLPFPYTGPTTFYSSAGALTQVPSRNARCIFVDTTRKNESINPKVWVATLSFFHSFNSTSGMLGQGLYTSTPEFRKVNQGINIASGTAGCMTIGGNASEIWTFVQANNGINQLLKYDAGTNQLITTYDHNSEPALPSGFIARAIYGDRKKRIWVGLASGGVMIYDENQQWHSLPSSVFPTGGAVNFNAIAGDKFGDIYIGTDQGLVYFDHGIGETNRLDDARYYRLYTKANGLPSNNINAMAYDTMRFKLWVATDAGVVAWDVPCIGTMSCDIKHKYYNKNAYSESLADGNWSNPAIWSSGLVPDSSTNVTIATNVTADINAKCNSIALIKPGSLKVNAGIKITLVEQSDPVIYTKEEKLKKQR